MQSSDLKNIYTGKATYHIMVRSKVDPKFISQLNKLPVTHTETKGQILSTLTGKIEDQETLSGIICISTMAIDRRNNLNMFNSSII